MRWSSGYDDAVYGAVPRRPWGCGLIRHPLGSENPQQPAWRTRWRRICGALKTGFGHKLPLADGRFWAPVRHIPAQRPAASEANTAPISRLSAGPCRCASSGSVYRCASLSATRYPR